ncbi:MFS transporter [Nocardia sp. NBC_00508]|uniref:MFS transporter n=1 Tax=Nocardia sp. NBC_00508 TaxID=2975992 RepID=UPI002E823026|nr:MFS transporter [Nocardia sp. NBC_00508]WUD67210.1 MFS transporter [Nocardia sp. NBC_00508]
MGSRGILGNRDFLLLWTGQAGSLVGFHGVRIAYPLVVLAVTGSPAAAGWAGFALSLPSLLLQIPAGVIADRIDRMRILMVCQFVGMTATVLAAVAIATHTPGLVPVLVVTAFIEGSVCVFVGVTEVGVIRDMVPPAQRPAAFSLLEAEQPIAALAGRAAGATIYGAARWLPFVVNAASYLYCLTALSLIRFRRPASPPPAEPADRSVGHGLRDGPRIVLGDPFLRASTAAIGASNIVIQVVLLLIVVALTTGGYPTWTVGVVLASAGVGGLFGAAAAARLVARSGPRLVYRGALWAWTALLVPIALSTNPFVLAACWCGIGGVGIASNVALTSYRVAVVPDHTLGRALATMGFVCDGAVAIGALGAGYLLSAVGVVTTGWIALAAMFVLAVLASSANRTPAQMADQR